MNKGCPKQIYQPSAILVASITCYSVNWSTWINQIESTDKLYIVYYKILRDVNALLDSSSAWHNGINNQMTNNRLKATFIISKSLVRNSYAYSKKNPQVSQKVLLLYILICSILLVQVQDGPELITRLNYIYRLIQVVYSRLCMKL